MTDGESLYDEQSTHRSWLEKITHALSVEPKDRREIISILRNATQREVLAPNTLSMIEGVLEVQESRVNDVMIPRSQMITLNKDLKLQDIIPLAVESGHSRFPVIGENKDEVLGILLAKDLLSFGFNLHDNKFNIRDILRPAVFIPESKRLDILLQDFRVNRNHMAIVVDEYGGVTGLITIEDVLEQIVGDIEDEFDIDGGPLIRKQSDHSYSVKALTTIEEFNEFFESDLSDEEVETIGGLVMRGMGRLPKRGEMIEIGHFYFKVLRADNRRIHLLQVNPKTLTDRDINSH